MDKIEMQITNDNDFGCVSILNRKFVVLLGGDTNASLDGDQIFVYYVQDQIFKKSKLKCPMVGEYEAISVNDREKDETVTFGFIRSRWKECGICDHLFPPQYLLKIICKYYWNEWIHLFGKSKGEHYKIDVLKLFD